MVTLDRIRLTGLLPKSPASAGLFHGPTLEGGASAHPPVVRSSGLAVAGVRLVDPPVGPGREELDRDGLRRDVPLVAEHVDALAARVGEPAAGAVGMARTGRVLGQVVGDRP